MDKELQDILERNFYDLLSKPAGKEEIKSLFKAKIEKVRQESWNEGYDEGRMDALTED